MKAGGEGVGGNGGEEGKERGRKDRRNERRKKRYWKGRPLMRGVPRDRYIVFYM